MRRHGCLATKRRQSARLLKEARAGGEARRESRACCADEFPEEGASSELSQVAVWRRACDRRRRGVPWLHDGDSSTVELVYEVL